MTDKHTEFVNRLLELEHRYIKPDFVNPV